MKDAIALLGSKDAVEEFIKGKQKHGDVEVEDDEPFRLLSEPAVKKDPQMRMF